MNELNLIESAYLAASLDCEGSIRVKNTGPGHGANPLSRPIIEVYNCNREFLENLRRLVGEGFVSTRGIPKSNHRLQFVYTLHSGRCVKELLVRMFPYLIIKRERAKLALAFYDFDNRCGKRRSLAQLAILRQIRTENQKNGHYPLSVVSPT